MPSKAFHVGGSPWPIPFFVPIPPVIPIRADDLTLDEIEAGVLQVLALGRMATLDEAAIARILGAVIEEATVTDWAQAFSAGYGIWWERRRLFQDLIFSLRGQFVAVS